jgi:hypothetical protein
MPVLSDKNLAKLVDYQLKHEEPKPKAKKVKRVKK